MKELLPRIGASAILVLLNDEPGAPAVVEAPEVHPFDEWAAWRAGSLRTRQEWPGCGASRQGKERRAVSANRLMRYLTIAELLYLHSVVIGQSGGSTR